MAQCRNHIRHHWRHRRPCTHTLAIIVDSTGLIAESNEQDNEYTKTITVVASNGSCAGNCDGDGAVTIDEILTMANMVPGRSVASGCAAGDPNGDGKALWCLYANRSASR